MVTWDGGGNAASQLAVARALAERGHDVRFLAHRSQQVAVEAAGARFRPYSRAPEADSRRPETDLIRDWEAKTRPQAFALARDRLLFGPALRFAEDVVAELGREPADVVCVDSLLIGGMLGGEAAGVPTVHMGHVVYPVAAPGVPPYGSGFLPARGAAGRLRDAGFRTVSSRALMPGFRTLNEGRAKLGLEPVHSFEDLIDRAALVLMLMSPAFDFAASAPLPDHVTYTGYVREGPAPGGAWDDPWPADDRRPLVVASFSTNFADQRPLAERVVRALGGLQVRGLITTGPALDLEGLALPPNVVVRDFVPHAAVFPSASLVVTHGGLGTLMTALSAGTPVVCLPDGRDRFDNAARVVALGAGVRTSVRAPARMLRRTIARALDEPILKRAAARTASTLAAEDGLGNAVQALEHVGRDRARTMTGVVAGADAAR